MNTDTIAAIATAMNQSGIGIIRISGNQSIEIVDKIFVNKNKKRTLMNYKSHTIHYGFICDGEEIIDEVMVSIMNKPNSFTTEDTVEINCHGGILLLNHILELVLKNGARLANPGEFTKRAFLNGRIDLSEAEAVMDLISSKNDLALKSSVKQLQGAISKKIKEIRKKIIYEIAFIESALDDPEHISLEEYPEKLLIIVDNLIEDVNKLLSTAENGKMIKEGINTVIVGKPNAGKSSLLNLLVGEEKAIVTEIAGTTRDILEEDIRISGISLHIIDTAGIRRAEDIVEKIGVEKAKQQVMEADLIIYVVDSSVPLDENDFDIIEMIQDKKCIILFNKTDLESLVSVENLKKRTGKDTVIIKTSTKENTGINDFENAVKEMFFHGEISLNDEVMITNMRHKEALQETLESLKQVKKSIKMQMPEDFYSIDLMSAYSSLGKIIGEEVEEDLVNEIFSKFCMGK
ncbi:MAG: tRNA uridine-5-carboxymethylaminomethyl(34) synthesis GTPase MnmE [Lachnospiraceae bacterium]|nr:tRNA uridine-5-carboxymethylaminomethyl(34) synthesis GTPase MnmE [Lachnospiraceae bacterium]